MILRPRVMDAHMIAIYSKHGKFNRALEDGVSQQRYHHIMYLENVNEELHFDTLGKLTAKGKNEMWTEIIHQIRLFDLEEIHLKPRPRKPTHQKCILGAGDNY